MFALSDLLLFSIFPIYACQSCLNNSCEAVVVLGIQIPQVTLEPHTAASVKAKEV